jgi:NEDD8-activating enzyme E1 regulatory subunit
MIKESPAFFESFSIVVATGLKEDESLLLANYLWDKNIPLVLVRSVGFIGSFRIIVPELTSISSLLSLMCSCGNTS